MRVFLIISSIFLAVLILLLFVRQDMYDQLYNEVERHMVNGEREIAVIVPTYNNARNRICIQNLHTILAQKYDNFHVYIIDDNSSDGTADVLAEYIRSHPRADKVTLQRNKKHLGPMANFYHPIHALDDHVIVINIDGDDWLPHENVFSFINKIYADKNIWLTYGQYKEFPSGAIGFCRGFPKQIIQSNSYRTYQLPVSHLRTYYAWLFKKIKKEDLMYKGDFVQATCDKVLMAPMIEMCGGRFMCVQDILYIYNTVNPIAETRINGILQGEIRDHLFKLPAYEPLAEVITDFAVDVKGKK